MHKKCSKYVVLYLMFCSMFYLFLNPYVKFDNGNKNNSKMELLQRRFNSGVLILFYTEKSIYGSLAKPV